MNSENLYNKSIITRMSQSLPFVPDLSLREQAQQQSQEVYSEQRFISLIEELSERSVLYFCPYDHSTLRAFFQQISYRQQTSLLPLSIVHQFISQLKQRNRAELTREAAYYEAIMTGHLRNGIQNVSRKELRKVMDRYEGELQVITQIMVENTKEAEFVSCELVLELIKQVRSELEDAVIPELSITKLKTMRLNNGEKNDEQQSPSKIISPIFEEIGEYQVKRLLDHFGSVVRRKLNFYRQFIADQQVIEDIQDLLTAITPLEKAIVNQVQQMIEANQHLNARCEEFNTVLANVQQEQSIQGEITEGLKTKINQLKEELCTAQVDNQELQSIGTLLKAAAMATQIELVQISKYCESIEQQLAEYRQHYEQIYAQYGKLVEDSKRKSMLSKEDEGRKIFSARSLKQQLEDTTHKLSRILTERQKQKKVNKEYKEQSDNKIILLQARLQELQRELKEKNEYLCEYIRESKLSGSKMSALRMSKLSVSRSKASFVFENNPQPAHSDKEDRASNARESIVSNASIINNRSSSHSSIDVERRFSKISKIKLASVIPIVEEEENSLEEISELYEEQNLVDVIKNDLSERPQEAFKKKPAQNSQKQPKKSELPLAALPKGKYFFSKGIQINIYGRKFETYILLTSKRFCYFDTKVRLEKQLPVEHIKEFIFMIDNPNLFVIKPFNIESLTSSKHIVNDMIFSTRNTARLQAFLANIRQTHRIAVTVKKAENSWLRVSNNDYNLGMGVPSYSNPFRLALAHQSVFYAQIKQDGIFASKTNSILVVQPAGVFCLQGEEPYELQEKRQFLCFLPFTQHLKLSDKKNSKEAPDKKLVIMYNKEWQKYYQIIFSTKQDMKKFKKIVEEQLQKNYQSKEQRRVKIISMFPSL